MKIAIALIVSLLAGCAGMTDIVSKQEVLYAPKTFQAGSQEDAYQIAAKIAKAQYAKALASDSAPSAIPIMVDAGIATVNGKCREWLARVSMAELRWAAGEGNLSVAQGLITGLLGAVGAHRDVVTAFGLGSAAWAGYDQNFHATALGMADYAMQSKMREVMDTGAVELRADAPRMTYPEAIDRLEGYAALCSVQAARAAVRSSLNATTTRATPAGTLQSVAKPAP